jgi:predicted O-linked N-acetylglucosamine transferase (SPINDLY family)
VPKSASHQARLAELTKKPLAAQDAGRLEEAEALWRSLIRRFPEEAQLHFQLASVLQKQERLESAAASYLRAAQLEPRAVAAHVNLANVLERLDKLSDAEAHYRAAIRLDPDFAVAHYNHGRLLQRQGRMSEAADAYRTAVRLQPNLTQAHHNLGNLLRRRGEHADAVQVYQRALQIDDSVPSIHVDLGDALQGTGQFADAEESYRRALALKPDEPSALYSLGTALQAQGRIADAIESYEQALRYKPAYVEARISLGGALHQLGDVDAAAEQYRRALGELPDLAHARFGVCIAQLPVIYENADELAERRARYRSALEALARDFEQLDDARCRVAADAVGAVQPFYLPYQGEDDRALQRTYGGMVGRLMSRRYPQWSVPLAMPEATAEGRLRIGFVSGFFRNHSGWSMQQGWAEAMDRSRFELYGYHTSAATDAKTPLIRGIFDRFVQGPLDLEHWAALIRRHQLHALIFPELGMDPMTARLGALRLAPIQMTSWGHPITSGLPTIDYFLSSDLMEPPEADNYYEERLVRLPNLGIYYRPPAVVPEAVDRNEFGIGRDAVVYWCCQSTYKYLPQHDDVFPRIARSVPNACFVFVVQQGGPVEQSFRRRLAAAFARRDLDADAFCRYLPSISAERFLGVTALCDAFLDSLDWSGCNTSIGAILIGKPIVTLPGRFMRGRHTAAMLWMMGQDDMIAGTVDEYVELAVKLGRDAALRAKVSVRVKAAGPRLLRDKAPVRALENFIAEAVAEYPSRHGAVHGTSIEEALESKSPKSDSDDENAHWALAARARPKDG